MIDSFSKKVYIKVKELFTQTENPLYNSFYGNEKEGFEEFKKHVNGDESLDWIVDDPSPTDDQINYVAILIMHKINRYYYMSGQQS